MCERGEIGNNSVVKSTKTSHGAPALTGRQGLSDATARVARVLMEIGAATAVDLAEQLFLTPTAVRRHLDVLMERGYVVASEEQPFGPTRRRGRGRPARFYTLTATGRGVFESSYADVAISAVSFVAEHLGEEGVTEFARQRAEALAAQYADVTGLPDTSQLVAALAALLTTDGYAANTATTPLGTQLCQHHCPMAEVAEQFPQFCEAERQAFADLLGVHVTRLSTIAGGSGVCTTLVHDTVAQGSVPNAARVLTPHPQPRNSSSTSDPDPERTSP